MLDNLRNITQLTLQRTAMTYTFPHVETMSRKPVKLHFRDSRSLRHIVEIWDQNAHNVLVLSNGETLYELDTDQVRAYLQRHKEFVTQTFEHFTLTLGDGWLQCLTESYRPRDDKQLLLKLVPWTTQQAFFSYCLVHRSARSEMILDLAKTPHLCAAAQISAIIARKMESRGFKILQSLLRTATPKCAAPDWLLDVLGALALSLRFRYFYAQQCEEEDPSKGERVDCVFRICKSLFAHYCWLARISKRTVLYSRSVQYPGTKHAVTEFFPFTESEDGFRQWIGEGYQNMAHMQWNEVV